MIAQFVRLLATVPLSPARNGFDNLVIQAIDPTELPFLNGIFVRALLERRKVAAIATQQIHEDTAYIVEAQWDLWTFDSETFKWKHGPQPLEIICRGLEYDGGSAATEGRFSVDLGLEHLFTGHAGILAPGAASNPFDSSNHPIEKHFANGCPWKRIAANMPPRPVKTSNNCSAGSNPLSARYRSSATSYGAREKKTLKRASMQLWPALARRF